MSDTTNTDYSAWTGRQLVDPSGDKIGKIAQIYVDDHTGQPTWATVKTGLFGSANSFVPLAGASASGDDLVAAYTKDKVKDAPNVEDDGDGYLSPDEETTLYDYYGLGVGAPAATASAGTVDAAPSATGTNETLTRSEEELRVGKETREAGRARLRKYVVTEQVHTTVPVSHEEVRVERTPITDAAPGGEISEDEREVVLHEERPVVAKEVVAKEQVRLSTDTVTEDSAVDEEVRKEVIDTDGEPGTTPGR